jgi:hypothetical protein
MSTATDAQLSHGLIKAINDYERLPFGTFPDEHDLRFGTFPEEDTMRGALVLRLDTILWNDAPPEPEGDGE